VLHLFDSVQHRWNMWVVGYDSNLQLEFLTELLGKKPTKTQIGMMILLGGMASMSIAGIVLFLRRPARPANPLVNSFLAFSNAAAGKGLVREPWESPMAFVRRVASRNSLPEEDVEAAIAGLDAQLYKVPAGSVEEGSNGPHAKPLMRILRRLKFRTLLQV